MKNWIQNRLKERSTWVGVCTLLGLAGVHIAPELKEPIATAGVAVVSAVFAITADK